MRLSEAIAIGRMLITPVGNTFLTTDGSKGCALGMAMKALGRDAVVRLGQAPTTTEYVAVMLPEYTWLRSRLPVTCVRCRSHIYCDNLLGLIIHLFDNHVMLFNHMTLDELIDYVRCVEPPEEKIYDLEEEADVEIQRNDVARVAGD